jgi:hypothetical protein
VSQDRQKGAQHRHTRTTQENESQIGTEPMCFARSSLPTALVLSSPCVCLVNLASLCPVPFPFVPQPVPSAPLPRTAQENDRQDNSSTPQTAAETKHRRERGQRREGRGGGRSGMGTDTEAHRRTASAGSAVLRWQPRRSLARWMPHEFVSVPQL